MYADGGSESSELEMTAEEEDEHDGEREQANAHARRATPAQIAGTPTIAIEDGAEDATVDATAAVTTAVQAEGDGNQEAQVEHKKKRRYGGIRLRAEKQQRKR